MHLKYTWTLQIKQVIKKHFSFLCRKNKQLYTIKQNKKKYMYISYIVIFRNQSLESKVKHTKWN